MKIWLPIIACFALAACANGTRVNHFGYGSYSGSAAHFAAPDGKMVLAVYGNPAPAGRKTIPQAVANGLNGTHVDPRTVFIPTDTPNLSGYRTVVVFGPSTPESVCMVASSDGLATASPAPMTAAFCFGGETLSYAVGEVPALVNSDDPLLASQMSLVGYTLFPDENPNYESDCGGNRPICGD